MDFKEFSASMQQAGFEEVVEREWQPLTTVAEHSHPFHARALLVRGEMWLSVQGRIQHLLAGDTFDLPPNLAHAERYGAEGALYWVARRNPPAA